MDYEVSGSRDTVPASSGGFVNWDGTVIGADGAIYDGSYVYSASLSVSLRKVPRNTAAALKNSIDNDEFGVTYDSPAHGTSGTAVLVSYRAESRRFGAAWDIDISVKIKPPGAEPPGGGL